MRLIHYSRTPLTSVHSCAHAEIGTYKTKGLWVSVEGPDDWVSWCKAEQFGLDRFCFATEVILAKNNQIYFISDAFGIDLFTERFVYGKYEKSPYPYGDGHRPYPYGDGHRVVDWPEVKKQYQGLIIAPYIWSRRMSDHTGWYYGWDCASGVIWDASAIADLRPIPLLLDMTSPQNNLVDNEK